ncbi:biotin/lipoyl-binding protein [Candidatus Bathyarchaeota archaeon]|nr:MAG: biotin/lipoyl-binding protein [Candidatus Bathyarchaeota archaeon]
MNLEFGLLITVIGVISVFSSLTAVALVCVALKRLFKGETVREAEAPQSEELDLKEVEEAGTRTFRIKLNGEDHDVKVEDLGIIGKECEVTSTSEVGDELEVVVGDVKYRVRVEKIEKTKVKYPTVIKKHVLVPEEAVEGAKEVITAPMQGTVVKLSVNVGDSVEKGSVLVVLETMKMENAIENTVSGIVKEIRVSEGDSVKDGDILVIIG